MAGYPCSPCCDGGGVCPDPGEEELDACAELENCLQGMYAVVSLTFVDDNFDDSVLSGSYVFEPQCPGWAMTDAAQESFRQKVMAAGVGPFPPVCDLDDYELSISVHCGEQMQFCVGWDTSLIDCENEADRPFFQACKLVPLPITISNGVSYDLTDITLGTFGPNLTAATITFYGKPCGSCPEPECENGPVVVVTATNVQEDAGLDACTDPPEAADIYTGCTYDLSVTVTAGVCPILACFWSDGNTEGCARTTYTITDECGDHGGIDLTLYVIDEGGCVVKYTVMLGDCCNCCAPEGGYTLEDEAYPTPIPDGWGSISSTCLVPLSGNLCNGGLNLCHLWCFYKITLDEGTFTDCGEVKPNSLRYLIDWGGLRDRNGDQLIDRCYDALDEIHVSHDAGFEGDGCICVTIIPFDELGCEGEPIYILFNTGIPSIDASCPTCA